ncbi:sulfite exporter TauE/SafE family protein [Desulfosarcina ovata]|uniref:sulfite exporter TauE/SafE family protein n=1 Tax=Desulfosarcina ovata TaxID=83564 RepID=UPI0012D2CC86|nr:sulfite exporter TauE/SafE family protein [Desulfosarcina ovata]
MATQSAAPCFTALWLGITTGFGQCAVFCAPAVSTYIMGSRQGLREGFKSFTVFSAGRVFMCAMLGVAVGLIGGAFIGRAKAFEYSSIIYGWVIIFIGGLMLLSPVCACRWTEDKNRWPAWLPGRFAFNPSTHLFVMGAALAIVPCPPMLVMLLYCLKMQSVMSSSILMLLFGIGTAVSPLLIISMAAGWFSGKIKTRVPQYRMMFQKISGVILILLGGSSVATF